MANKKTETEREIEELARKDAFISADLLRKGISENCALAQYLLGTYYYYGTRIDEFPKDKYKGLELFHSAAAGGNPDAQFNLGLAYRTGSGVPENKELSVKYFRMAAEQGESDSQHNLACAYRLGEGIEKNDAEAAKWFRKAAEQGDSLAMFSLAYLYFSGEGVAVDYAEGVRLLYESAQKGNQVAQFELGRRCYYGDCVAKDENIGLEWIKLAAQQNNPDACRFLNEKTVGTAGKNTSGDDTKSETPAPIKSEAEKLYEEGLALVEGADDDRERETAGFELICRASDMDYPQAIFYLGHNLFLSEKYEKAFPFFERAAYFKHVRALSFLGHCYYNGVGVEVNKKDGLRFWNLAAAEGDGEAMYSLGNLFFFGDYVAKDRARALEWFERSAGCCFLPAAVRLSKIYSMPCEDKKEEEYEKALRYLRLAAELGDPDSQHDWAAACFSAHDPDEAMKWIRLAAEQGQVNAQCTLGWAYYKGINGCGIDYGKAYDLFKESADAGYEESINNLGELHEHGRGVKQSWSKAEKYYREAIRKGSASAEINLGFMYYYGRGRVKKNLHLALMLFSMAEEHADCRHQEEMKTVGTLIKEVDEMAKIFSRDEVNLNSLNEILELYYETKIEEADEEIALPDLKIRILLSEEKTVISLRAMIVLPSKRISAERVLNFINECNNGFIMVRSSQREFSDTGEKIILFNYDLDYHNGLIPAALIWNINRFNEICEVLIDKAREAQLL